MNQKINLPAYFGLFLILSGVSYLLFSKLVPVGTSIKSPGGNTAQTGATQTPQKTGVLTFSGPKTEVCPLNGALYTEEEKAIWEKRRPLTVMIENHSDSRPQSGLQNADIVYEAVAEGGITRFMGVFYCGAVAGSTNKYDVGPVRSARTYFLDLASEYGDYPLYAHVGGSNCSGPKLPSGKEGPCTTNVKAQALEQLASYGWTNKGTWGDLSQFSLPYKVCRREPERTGDVRATEHTMYCSTNELWNVAESRGLTNMTLVNKTPWDKKYVSWSFNEKDSAASSPSANKISFDFWGDNAYAVSWAYNSTDNNYIRSNGGQPHLDFNTGKALTTKNLVIQFAKESRSIDEHLHNLYQVVGSGSGLLFQNGNKTEITWSKSSRQSRTVFKDKNGKEVNFVPGNIWVEILPLNNKVNYDNG